MANKSIKASKTSIISVFMASHDNSRLIPKNGTAFAIIKLQILNEVIVCLFKSKLSKPAKLLPGSSY